MDPHLVELPGGGPAELRVRANAINILVGEAEPSYSFDRAGRLIGAFEAGVNYRRGLDNRVLAKWQVAGRRERRWLPAGEADEFLVGAYDLAGAVAARAGVPEANILRGWTAATLAADAARFREIYRPVSILPPDQYLSLVLQATEGCSYNRCTFCDFYSDRPFRIKSGEELRRHIKAVRDFFGPALGLRKSLFLADANALVAPVARIHDWLDVIDEAAILPGAGLYSFIDAFDVHRKSEAEWRTMAARGVKRLYIGLESGDDGLLEFLRKPGCVADAVQAVTTLKAAGIAVSVIVMIGAGGDRYAGAHVAGTAAALNSMPLAKRDIIYLSPFVDHPGSEYAMAAKEAGIRPLTEDESLAQEMALRAAFTARNPANAPQWSRYDIREFVY